MWKFTKPRATLERLIQWNYKLMFEIFECMLLFLNTYLFGNFTQDITQVNTKFLKRMHAFIFTISLSFATQNLF